MVSLARKINYSTRLLNYGVSGFFSDRSVSPLIRRALSAPGHWTITTFGQLVEALEGDITFCVLPDKQSIVQMLSDRLRNKTRLLSSIQSMTKMPEFDKLLEYGDDTVRYILHKMRMHSVITVWFPLLKRITGADPVSEHERGNVRVMRERWVAWGQEHGFFGSEKNSCNEEAKTV